MSPSDYLRLGLQLNAPISMLVGLWIAARWLSDLKTWLAQIGALSFISNRAGQLILWVALGVLFGSPVADWVGVLGTGVELLLFRAANMGSMSTVWGTESFAVYSQIAILMILVVYALVVWVGYRLWPEAVEDEGAVNTSLGLEEWFVLFAAASLVNRFVQSVIQSLIWLPVPNSIEMGRLSSVGFFGAWLLGLAILAAVLLVLLNSLRRHQSTG